MEARELRIGNWIKIIETITKVEGFCIWDNMIQSNNFTDRNINEFEPIPLTEEWLVRFGFAKENNYLWDVNEPHNVKFKFKKDGTIWRGNVLEVHFGCNFSTKRNKQMLYVHQLQNLYFALTNTELLLKNSNSGNTNYSPK